jgi:long-chain acyl-CoA synthetase
LAEIFLFRVGETPNDIGWEYPDASGAWLPMSWKECNERVRVLAAGLRALGIQPEERVAILSTTRIEWILADLAIMAAGAACTTIYPSNTPAECDFILNDSATRIVFAEDASQVAKLQQIRAQIPGVVNVILTDGASSEDGWVLSWADFIKRGQAADKADPEAYERVIAGIKREHLATLIYTSGTTGRPKGVRLVHDNWVYEAEAIESVGVFNHEDKQFLWLPMSHSFGKVLEVVTIMCNVPTAVDGRDPKKVVTLLATVRPTWMGAPPRIFEKAYSSILLNARAAGGLKTKIFEWALSVGREVSKVRQEYKEPTGLLALKLKIAEKLVFGKVRDRFGGRIRFFISGSAPLSRELAEFFHALGMPILEGYGLTESSAASFINLPDNFRFGTVGPALPGIDVNIVPDTGEVLFRGRGIMRGYHNLPEETAATVDGQGYLHTGDKGEIDERGRLRITGRIKELIKTSGGKYVAPAKLESAMKAASPFISQVVVHGDNRNYCSALIVLDVDRLPEWGAANGHAGKSFTELSALPEMKAAVEAALKVVNAELASYETIKKFTILPNDFSVDTGELTASFKVKRRFVEQKFKAELDAMYS